MVTLPFRRTRTNRRLPPLLETDQPAPGALRLELDPSDDDEGRVRLRQIQMMEFPHTKAPDHD